MMKKWHKTICVDSIALLLGMALTLAFAPYEVYPLAILAPAGLLALWFNVSPKRAFWLGFLFGLGWFGTGVYWVFISIHLFGNVSNFFSALITAGFIAILALFPAFAGYTTNRYFPIPNKTKLLFAFPVIWVFSEWLRSFLFTGFPWFFIGYSQTNSPLKGYAPLFSVYGVSLAVFMSAALLVYGMLAYRQKQYRTIYLSLFAFVSIWVGGGLLNTIPWTTPEGPPISISLVQGDIEQAIKWTPEHLQLSFDRYETLTKPLWGKSKIIIWPESAIPLPLQAAAPFIEVMDQKALASHSALILGIPIKAKTEDNYYNAIISLGKNKNVYTKRRLVPFGEYVPAFSWLLYFFDKMNMPISTLIPGNFIQNPIVIDQVKILPSICYEIAFPELIRTTDPTIGILLTLTNDAWFGESAAQAQHLQMAAMRSIELRRPTIFVSNDGITGVLSPDGTIESVAPPHQVFVLTTTVQPRIGLTPWMRNGIDPLFVLLLSLLIVAIRFRKKS